MRVYYVSSTLCYKNIDNYYRAESMKTNLCSSEKELVTVSCSSSSLSSISVNICRNFHKHLFMPISSSMEYCRNKDKAKQCVIHLKPQLFVLATNMCLSVFIGEARASGVYASARGSAEVVSNLHSLASHMQICYSN